jgi:hypothetical protein
MNEQVDEKGQDESVPDETVTDGIMSELHREEEFAAERFASAMESAERGHPLDQRDLEDAELAPMVRTAGLLHSTWNSVSPDLDYFTRTRSTILAAMPQPAEEPAVPLSLIDRLWRSPAFTPIASAAAAGMAAVFITLQFVGGGAATVAPLAASLEPVPSAESAPSVTAIQPPRLIAPDGPTSIASLDARPHENVLAESDPVLNITTALDRLVTNIGVLGLRAQLHEPISAGLLHSISEDLAGVTERISEGPESVERSDVILFAQQAVEGVTIMNELLVEGAASGALAAARITAELGRSTAALYFFNNPPN